MLSCRGENTALRSGARKNSPGSVDAAGAIGPYFCSEQSRILDSICLGSNKLDLISISVRNAVAANNFEDLLPLREQVNKLRDEIVCNVERLARHRFEHAC